MPCSYEQYFAFLAPTRFRMMGISRTQVTALVAISLPFLIAATTSSLGWRLVAYAGVIVWALFSHWLANRWRRQYWSRGRGPPLRNMKECDAAITEHRLDKLISMLDPHPPIACQDLVIELEPAEKELLGRRAGKMEPYWKFYGMIVALGSAGMSLLKAPPPKAVKSFVFFLLAAAFAAVVTVALEEAHGSWGHRFADYVRLLRLGKRRLDLLVLKSGLPASTGTGQIAVPLATAHAMSPMASPDQTAPKSHTATRSILAHDATPAWQPHLGAVPTVQATSSKH